MSRFLGVRRGVSEPSFHVSEVPGRVPHGYTLVELLVTVALIGILGTMGFRVATEGMRRAKVSAAGSQVSFVFMRARQNAVVEHQRFFVIVRSVGADRIESVQIVRDDGSGVYESDQDPVVETVRLELGVHLGDGRGNTTTLAEIETGVYALAFGPRGEARNPTTGELVTGLVNVRVPSVMQGGWLRFAAINIAASGAVQHRNHKEVDLGGGTL